MKTFKMKDGTIVNYKEGLTEEEFISLINISIKAYEGNDDDLDNLSFTRYNPVAMEKYFNRLLFIICIKDFNEEDFDKYFVEGIHLLLRREVINVQYAYDVLKSMVNDSLNVGNILDVNLRTLIRIIENKLPEKNELEKLLKKLPKEWSKVFGEHENLVNMPKKEFDEKYNNKVDETK